MRPYGLIPSSPAKPFADPLGSKHERPPLSTDRWYPLAARRYRHTPCVGGLSVSHCRSLNTVSMGEPRIHA